MMPTRVATRIRAAGVAMMTRAGMMARAAGCCRLWTCCLSGWSWYCHPTQNTEPREQTYPQNVFHGKSPKA